ncbi:MAG: YdcF family protein [Proteobacteria bacterium]|nr:YdcF family protein [Pseudomonadota bacterium]
MPSRRILRRRFIALATVCTVALWLGGFFVFMQSIPRAKPMARPKTDGVAVLTGGSLRLEAGLALLAEGLAQKLFVSGVHRGVDVAELLRISRHSPEALDCCIVLDYAAGDTRGNARETAEWMARENFRSLRLVTASYHMPRSMLEFRSAMAGVTILPYPVFPAHVRLDDWWRWPGTALLLFGEYNKFLLVWAREMIRPVAPIARNEVT